MNKINQFLDRLSDYLVHRKGLFPLIGVLLVIVNAIFQFIPQIGWLGEKNILLHLGVIIALLGIMLSWAL